MPRGIFGLKQVYNEQVAGTWSTTSNAWLTASLLSGQYDYGFVVNGVGGNTPNSGTMNERNKIDFSNDTVNASFKEQKVISSNNDTLGSTGFASPGYHYTLYGSNYYLPNNPHAEKISFATDTLQVCEHVNRSTSNGTFAAGVSNDTHGYVIGGGTGPTDTVKKLDFSNDLFSAITTLPASIAVAKSGASSAGNADYAWVGGGKLAPGSSNAISETGSATVERIDYSSDSSTPIVKGSLNAARGYLAATGNANQGYWAGGGANTNANVSSVDMIDYSNDGVSASPKGNLLSALWGLSAMGSQQFGYFAGGAGNNATPFGRSSPNGINTWKLATGIVSTVQRLDYSNDTVQLSPKGPLGEERYLTVASSAKADAKTGTTKNALLAQPFPQGTDAGYWVSGNLATTTVQRIDFSNDNYSFIKGPLTNARSEAAMTGNVSGGFVSGGNPGPLASIERIDYANDTANAVVKGNLTSTRRRHSGVGNNEFGYFSGGIPGNVTTVERIDYSNDTANAIGRFNLADIRYSRSATGNQSQGYFVGGKAPAISKIERIDYANDTADATRKGSLSSVKYRAAATGNANFGYIAGGLKGATPSTDALSTIDRIDYANDSSGSSPKGSLDAARYGMGATGNQNFGYFAGGGTSAGGGTRNSYVQRIDYANDTATTVRSTNMLSDGSATPLVDPKYGIMTTDAASPKEHGNHLRSVPFALPKSFGSYSVSAPQGTDIGYFVAGYGSFGAIKSTIDRLDYQSDTLDTVQRGFLTVTRYASAATSNASGAYVIGGINPSSSPSILSSIERINFFNDSVDASPKGPLTSGRSYGAATGNTSFGYHGGGNSSPGPIVSTIDRIDYANDGIDTVVRTSLAFPTPRTNIGATGNQNFGYFAGGAPNPKVSLIIRLDYSNDCANTSPKGPLTSERSAVSGTGNADFAYFAGGGIAPSGHVSTIDRLDYANDTNSASPKGFLNSARSIMNGATGNRSNGYFAGGYDGDNVSTVERIDYSNDTDLAVTTGSLTVGRNLGGAASSRAYAIPLLNTVNYAAGTVGTPNTGYFTGGSSEYSIVNRIDFSNDTASAVRTGNLSPGHPGNRFAVSGSSSTTHGYFVGGGNPQTTTVERIEYINDTASPSIRGSLPTANVYLAGTGNANFGYHVGGEYDSRVKVNRIDYSNDLANLLVRGNLNNPRRESAATSNANFGYIAANVSPKTSTIERIDYASDTSTPAPKGDLTRETSRLGAAGNANFGYFAGGETPSSSPNRTTTIDRIDYANDTVGGSPKGFLLVGRHGHTGTGNQNFGYFAGGATPSPGFSSSVDRIDYANDTATAVKRGSLTHSTNLHTGVSASQGGVFIGNPIVANVPVYGPATPSTIYGYFAGDLDPNDRVSRLDFTNDTRAMVNTGAVSNPAWGESGSRFSSTTYGYLASGNYGRTAVQRLDYSNDTEDMALRANLTIKHAQSAGVNSLTFGYVAGGMTYPSPTGFNPTSFISRVSFANDTATPVATGNLIVVAKEFSGTGNQSFGYFNKVKVVQKIDYSNDTVSTTPVADSNVNSGGRDGAATGNANFGYFNASNNTLNRVDFANDTTTPSPKSLVAYSSLTAVGNAECGYWAGGFANGGTNVMTKVTFANDSAQGVYKDAFAQSTPNDPGYRFHSFGAGINGLPQ